ncbi:uncharacterized protein LOC142321924 isoform X2 [Lycorma delicatula]|uniref:uncharacterized protein LOC142321924 isoform X2 n=1 Tax=Lycorma delicatula TaxID=130591 RepID=UPI003F514C00
MNNTENDIIEMDTLFIKEECSETIHNNNYDDGDNETKEIDNYNQHIQNLLNAESNIASGDYIQSDINKEISNEVNIKKEDQIIDLPEIVDFSNPAGPSSDKMTCDSESSRLLVKQPYRSKTKRTKRIVKNAKKKPKKNSDFATCNICSAQLENKKDFENHIESHFIDGDSKVCDKNALECNDCGKLFPSKRLLKRHLVTHSNDRPYTCDICHKSYKRLNDVAVHKKKHTREKLLSCDICDFTTVYRSALTTHRKRHSQEYEYRCDKCGKGFFVKKYLEEHENFHSGEKPFRCDICGKAFPYTRYLVAHKKDQHPDGRVPVKINNCNICGKIFSHRSSLRLHIASHTGTNVCLCDICGKELTNKEHLKFHRRIHTGEKPNICNVCGKGFAKSCNLTLHLRTHSGERPYSCTTCGKSFSQRSTLVIHSRYHSGERPYVCHICEKGFVCQALLTTHLKGHCMMSDDL